MSVAPSPAAPAPPRRRGRKLLIGLAVVLTGLAALAWFAPAIVAETGLRDRVTGAVAEHLNGTVAVDGMSLSWLSPVELRGVTVTDPAGRKTLEAATVRTSLTLMELAAGPADLGTVTVTDPVVHVVTRPGGSNVEDVLAKVLTDPTPASTADRTAVQVVVTGGKLVLSDDGDPAEHALDGVTVTVAVPAPRADPVTVRVAAAGLTADLSAGPELGVKVTADRLDLTPFGPAVRRFSPGTTAAGTLTGHADVARVTPPTGPPTVTGSGDLTVTGLDAAGPWAGTPGDHFRQARVAVKAGRVVVHGTALSLTDASLVCDAGSAAVTAAVGLTDPVADLVTTPGLRVAADFDLAKLAAVAPKLLRLRPGTTVTAGRFKADIASTATAAGTNWVGRIDAAKLRGERGGKPLGWEEPLWVAFDGHLTPDLLPVFDKLECKAEFVGLAARGSASKFLVMANLDLDRLALRLADFIDLGGVSFGGVGELKVTGDPRPGGGLVVAATAGLTGFRFADGTGKVFTEPALTVTATAAGSHAPDRPIHLDAATVAVVAGPDRIDATLIEPVVNLRKTRTGKAKLSAAGDLGRWRDRAAQLAAVPADWGVGGTGTAAATIAVRGTVVAADGVTVDLKDARFVGAGLDLDEPTVAAAGAAAWDRSTGVVTLTGVSAKALTGTLDAQTVTLTPTPAGRSLAAVAGLSADLPRVQRALKMARTVGGTAAGTVTARHDGTGTAFDAAGRVTDFVVGDPAKPTWREPVLDLKAVGRLDPAADALTLTNFSVGRDGLTAAGKADLAALSGRRTLTAAGDLAYDLARLQPQLRDLLGPTATAAGAGAKPFRVTGDLGGDVAATLDGTAGLGWQHLAAYGFDVGPAAATATLKAGVVAVTPVAATFGGGTVTAEPAVDLTRGVLTVKPGRLVDHAKLTPKALSQALGFALPAFANATQADGLVSFDAADAAVPLADANKAAVRGTLTVHSAAVTPGPVIAEVAKLLGAQSATLTLPAEQAVPVRVENGRVYHDNFKVQLGESTVSTGGSVGLDKSLALVIETPVPPKLYAAGLANNPLLKATLAKQRVKIPVSGTLARPVLDLRGAEQSVAAAVRGAGKDLLKSPEVKEKLRDRLFEELNKKVGGK